MRLHDSNRIHGQGQVHIITLLFFQCRFIVGQPSVNCWYTVGPQLAHSTPTVGQQTFTGAFLQFYICAPFPIKQL